MGRTLGKAHRTYADFLDFLARLYYSMGDFAAAAPLYQQALEIRRAALGENNPDFASSLYNVWVSSGVHEFQRLLVYWNSHRQNASLFISINIKNFAEGRLNRSHGIAHFVEPVAPKLLDRRNLFGLTDLALDVFPERGDVKTTHHCRPNIGEIDLVVHIDAEKILAESAFLTVLACSGDALLEGD